MRKLVAAVALMFFLLASISLAAPPVKDPQVSETNLPSKHVIEGVPCYQGGPYESGPASLSMVLGFYGKDFTKEEIARSGKGKKGVNASDLEDFARWKKFKVFTFSGKDTKKVKYWLTQGYPLIVFGLVPDNWYRSKSSGSGLYVVIIGYDDEGQFFIANDPEGGCNVQIPYGVFKDFHSMTSMGVSRKIPVDPYYVLCVYPKE